MKHLLILLCILVPASAFGATYRNIDYLDTLGEVQGLFPGATFTRLTPPWAGESETMCKIEGIGLRGTIMLRLRDVRPKFRNQARAEKNKARKKYLEEQANDSDANSLFVVRVRWIPADPVALSRVIGKYGAPEEKGYDDEAMKRYCNWKQKGLFAYLSTDERSVVSLDFEYTDQEKRAALMKRADGIPCYIREEVIKTTR